MTSVRLPGFAAQERFSTEVYLDNMLHYTDMFLQGQRGIHVTHDVECHFHNQGSNGTSNREENVYADLQSMPAVVNDAPLRRWAQGGGAAGQASRGTG